MGETSPLTPGISGGGKPFRLSMLIYDTRYRSAVFQIVALITLLIFFYWLFVNTRSNLATLEKSFGFGFLASPSGYDINQRLIAYNSQSTHLRAAFVGILNTLLVALLGCALATILGVIIGVLRLSRNWLVARLMTIYIETFRNVPVLLWIIFFWAILSELLPQPRDFRGDSPTASMLFDTFAFTNRGFYIPKPLWSNGLEPLRLFDNVVVLDSNVLLMIATLIIALFLRSQYIARAERIQVKTGNRPATWYVSLALIFIPLTALAIFLGLHWERPVLRGFNFTDGIYMRSSLIALWLALSVYTAAFIAEIVRAGIEAISKGQTEAALSVGLTPWRTMALIILPQAQRVIIPPLISQFLNLTKNSSLAIAVGYMDLVGTLGGVTLNQTGKELETLSLVMAIYLSVSLSISAAMNWYNARVKLKER